MMYRILNVRQEREKDFKVWFTDDYWDLFVWISKEKRISSFQLGFGKPSNERLILWKQNGPLRFAKVEGGESDPMANQSPILKRSADIPIDEVIQRFREDSKKVDPGVVRFILSKLEEWAAKKNDPE